MAKKKQRSTQTSKGERSPLNKKLIKASRREYNGSTAQMNNKLAAWKRGKNVMLTIENPNKNETNKRFIRVNANDVWKGKTA